MKLLKIDGLASLKSSPKVGQTSGAVNSGGKGVIGKKLQPDLDQARLFLKIFARDEPVTFQTFDDSENKRPWLAKVLHGTLDDHAQELTRLNNEGAGIFFTVNRTNGQGRKGENIVSVRALFVDLDGAPLAPVKDAPVKPHIVVESSPGRYHAYWKVSDCPLENFPSIQKALAAKFNGDASVHDLSRVMRLPGFFHRKAEAVMTVMEP